MTCLELVSKLLKNILQFNYDLFDVLGAKYGICGSKICSEKDGVELTSDKAVEYMVAHNNALMILQSNEQMIYSANNSLSESVVNSNNIVANNNESGEETCLIAETSSTTLKENSELLLLSKYEIRAGLFSATIQKKLLCGSSMKPNEIRDIVQRTVDEIHSTITSRVPAGSFRLFVKKFVDSHQNCFVLKDAEGVYTLTINYTHFNYFLTQLQIIKSLIK